VTIGLVPILGGERRKHPGPGGGVLGLYPFQGTQDEGLGIGGRGGHVGSVQGI